MLITMVGLSCLTISLCLTLFYFNVTATTVIYTLSLHDALPICFRPQALHFGVQRVLVGLLRRGRRGVEEHVEQALADRKSTRLNSSHSSISYAVFCLKKKKNRDVL